MDRTAEIAHALYGAAGRLGWEAGRLVEVQLLAMNRSHKAIYTLFRSTAPADLLSTIGSWGDTLTDDQVLAALRMFNREGTTYREIVYAVEP